MKINFTIDDTVSDDEVSYILRGLSHDIDIGGLSFWSNSSFRVFDSNGDPVGEVNISSPVPLQAPESPVEA